MLAGWKLLIPKSKMSVNGFRSRAEKRELGAGLIAKCDASSSYSPDPGCSAECPTDRQEYTRLAASTHLNPGSAPPSKNPKPVSCWEREAAAFSTRADRTVKMEWRTERDWSRRHDVLHAGLLPATPESDQFPSGT